MSKVHGGLQGLRNRFMLHKLRAIIKGERVHASLEGAQQADDVVTHDARRPAEASRADREEGGSLHHRHQHTVAILPNHRIAFPVTNPGFLLHDVRPLLNRDAIGGYMKRARLSHIVCAAACPLAAERASTGRGGWHPRR